MSASESDPLLAQDRSNGWEAAAPWFIGYSRRSTIGVGRVRSWVSTLPSGAAVLDLGCGAGSLRSDILFSRDFTVSALDASPTLVSAYRRQYPTARVACEPVEESPFFEQTFDGILAWGLVFLLPADTQRRIMHRVARALASGGSLLFTSPAQAGEWSDVTTGRTSVSMGAEAYRTLLAETGLVLRAEYEDEGENHYYEAVKA